MTSVILLIHLFLAISLVVVVLLQRSEGGALGIGGGTMGGLMTSRGSASLLTRVTGIIAAGFIITSLSLAILAGNTGTSRSILVEPVSTDPATPAKPQAPAVPLAK